MQAISAKEDLQYDAENAAGEMFSELKKKKEEWAYLDLSKKISILREISDRAGEKRVGEKIAIEHMKARKIDPTTPEGMSAKGFSPPPFFF